MIVNEIRLQFESTQRQFERILKMLMEGAFLAEDDFNELLHTLAELKNSQERCLRFFTEENLLDQRDTAGMSLSRAEEIARCYEETKAKERQCRAARAVALEFAAIRTADDAIRAELETHQQRLSACDAARLLEMEESGALGPYRELIVCVKEPESAREHADSLAGIFGYQLAFGILTGKLTLPEPEREPAASAAEEGMPEPLREDADDAAAEPNAESEPNTEAQPEQKAEAEPERKAEAEPNAEVQKIPDEAREEMSAKMPDAPAAQTPDLPPLVDAALLGELTVERKSKQLKGPKAFLSLAQNQRWKRNYIMNIAAMSMHGYFSLETLTKMNASADSGLYEQCLALLVKEGYLVRYAVKGAPEKCLYGATPEGMAIFKKDALKRYFHKHTPEWNAEDIKDGADFLRRYEGERVFNMMRSEEVSTFAEYYQDGNGGFLRLAQRESAPVVCVVVPAAVYTRQDAPESIERWRKRLCKAATAADGDLTVFLTVHDAEQIAGWRGYFQRNAEFSERVRLFCGVIGNDVYRDAEGREQSLTDYFQGLEQASKANGNAEEASARPAERDSENDIGKAEPDGETFRMEARAASDETEERADIAALTENDLEPAGPEPAADGMEASAQSQQADSFPKQIDIQTRTVQENAALLLEQPEDIRLNQLLCMIVQLISENRIAEAVSLAESAAESPAFGAKVKNFYRAFRQSVQQPGQNYQYSSGEIDDQQSHLISEEEIGDGHSLRTLHQTMILTNALWAMAFPSAAYDHNLYNNAGMVVSGEMRDALSSEISAIDHLMKLLGSDLKELSFQNDGLGFSPSVIAGLADNGEQEKNRLALGRKAETLKKTPTSTVQITGLETFLKQAVGPTSEIGYALRVLAEDRRGEAGEIRNRLEKNLGLARLEITDGWLEEYINNCWNNLRKENPDIKVKRLDKDSPAQRVCKKALTERLCVIVDWLAIVEGNQNSGFLKFRDQYARLWNQVKTALGDLNDAMLEAAASDRSIVACRKLLGLTVNRMQKALDSLPAEDETRFYEALWKTPELILGTSGESLIVPELYDIPGLEPWVFLLRGAAAPPESAEDILSQIDDYKSERWYRNFGMEALLRRAAALPPIDRTESIQMAQDAMEQAIQEFEGSIRMDRAYGRLQEYVMETAFSTLKVVKEIYRRTGDFASFRGFLSQLQRTLDKTISQQMEKYRRRVQELERQADYAKSPMLEVIHKALESGSLNSVDTYINYMESGETELPSSIKNRTGEKNFLAEFQSCEDAYYLECQKHSGNAMSNWAGTALERMDKQYQHWTSSNERVAGQNWVNNWLQSKNSPTGPERVRTLLNGLGFEVQAVVRMSSGGRIGTNECYQVESKRVSTALTDYPHPVYKFGTEISVPMNVVCLYGCQGISTLLSVMTNDLHLSGSTIVLMDGSLTSRDRRLMAEKFKTGTSGQNPFLLIDRVLALYLASVDKGDRQKAMLRCTLPYTFEVLYGSGSGAVPEEMFIGRMMEMHDLRSEQGPSLVYGGRQLGKTALLSRASKTLNAPKKKEYSFCVEVKDFGSEVLLERVNRQLTRLELLENGCASIPELCETLQDLWADKKINMLRIFVDEVDCLFEEFQRDDYAALRPFINLRDNTKHKVKFVFAGTHNVAATDIAERENNNLIHMGKPLCIKPLSSDDAMDLIRIPMAYLGFEIGEPQIELILSNTNSYPGLIHMFCSALIQSVCRDYDQCCGDEPYPPYRISDAQMQTVFREQDIRKEIGQRVMATIRLNRKYKAVSYLLALMVYEDRDKGRSSLYGYTAKELQSYNQKEIKLPLVAKIKEKDLNTLMDEMENMGILWKNRQMQKFRFRQQDFLEYIGDSEKLLEALLEEDWESV